MGASSSFHPVPPFRLSILFLFADIPLLLSLFLPFEWLVDLPLPLTSAPLYFFCSNLYVLCPATDCTPARHGICGNQLFCPSSARLHRKLTGPEMRGTVV
ncbi:hypothetical protein BJX76DRAFT_234801 [Aspergillus varians]